MGEPIITLHPAGKQGVHIDRAMYELIRQAILASLAQRMHVIADLFRVYHLDSCLFDPPLSPEQTSRLKAGLDGFS